MLTMSRMEAGRRLGVGLGALIKDVPVVLAVSPGGARVGCEIAKAFGAPLDVIAVSRLEVPGRLHSTFGAVADGAVLVLSRRVLELGLPTSYVAGLVDFARREVERLASKWRGEASPVPVTDRDVVLADDGASDAVELAAAAQAVRRAGPRRLILAAPCGSRDLCAALEGCCDHQMFLHEPGAVESVMVRDPNFTQTTPRDVRGMVRHSRRDVDPVTARV